MSIIDKIVFQSYFSLIKSPTQQQVWIAVFPFNPILVWLNLPQHGMLLCNLCIFFQSYFSLIKSCGEARSGNKII